MRAAFVAVLSLFLLTACDSTLSLKDLRQAPMNEDPYRAALAAEYRDFSEEKQRAYDWWTSKYFADKGLFAAYGREVAPEDPALWGVTDPEFTEARERLLAAIAAQSAKRPELTALAVVDYDRWVELQNNGWDAGRISGARTMFYATLEDLEAAAKPTVATGGLKHSRAVVVVPSVAETTSAVLYFPFDGDHLTDSARAALDEMLKYIRAAGPVTVSINGHADRVGADDYNMTLSERRAKFVRETLEASGVPAKQIEYFAFGESDPKVPTEDNVAEAHNRRVEIFLE